MATVKVYQNGASSYMGNPGTHERSPRGEVKGWTAAAARRQRNWLWTVDAERLTGHGYAATVTMRDCPPTASEFHRLRRAWLKRVERMGAVRVHWVVEWTARKIPHLHAAVYFAEPLDAMERDMLAVHWVIVAREFGTGLQGQEVKEITGAMGWLKYLSKHAARGASHYQRSGHPEGWEKTGRLWGHTGGWPVDEPIEIPGLTNEEFWRYRRILRGWAIADARKLKDWSRVAYLRRAGRPNDRHTSSYQAVSEWIPQEVSLRLWDYLRTTKNEEKY